MAGKSPRSAAVKARLLRAMYMGMPNDVAMRPTFGWDDERTFTRTDSGGRPWSMTAAPTATVTRPEVQVLCAWEYLDDSGQPVETPIGDFNPDRALITMFGEQYDEVCPLVDGERVKFDWVRISGTKFEWSKEVPVRGLHDIDVHQILVVTPDKS